MYNGSAAHRHSFHNCPGESSSGGGIMINRNLKHIFTILVILTILVPISGTVSANPNSPQAEPIYVDTTEDQYDLIPDGACSLREAITTINTGGAFGGCPDPIGTTQIQLDYGVTYILKINGAGEDNNATGDLDILADMTIQGNYSTVNADLIDRVLDVHSGTTVVINELTIQDGYTVGIPGGGVYSEGDLTLNDSTVQSNTVTGIFTNGGGIFSYNNSLTLNHSYINDNHAPDGYGGGITIWGGDLICDESTFYFNDAGMGGGLFILNVAEEHARITRCDIRANYAEYGGGLYNAGATLIENSSFVNNFAYSYGGNMYNGRSSGLGPTPDLAIVGTEISYGSASEGGGIFNDLPSFVSIKYSTISLNVARESSGGGVSNYGEDGTGAFTIDHTTIADNGSSLSGSAIASGTSGLVALPVLVTNSIIAGPSLTSLCNYPLDPDSYGNLETTNTCNLDPSPGYGNYVNTPANFASALYFNGSKYRIGFYHNPAWTYALLPTSLAVDHADCALYTEDQRGYPLDVDGDGDGNPQCDMGSYELQRFSFLPLLKRP
jgi:CSLREA domain-containing protein